VRRSLRCGRSVVTVCPSQPVQDCSFPAYFYTQPMATGPGFYDNLCPQSWQDGSAATFTLQDPHQQSKSPCLAPFCVSPFFVCASRSHIC